MEFLLECVGFPPDTDFVALARRIESEGEPAPWRGRRGADADDELHRFLPLAGGVELLLDRERGQDFETIMPQCRVPHRLRVAVRSLATLPDSPFDALLLGRANPPAPLDDAGPAPDESWHVAANLIDRRRLPKGLPIGHVLALSLAGFALDVSYVGPNEGGKDPEVLARPRGAALEQLADDPEKRGDDRAGNYEGHQGGRQDRAAQLADGLAVQHHQRLGSGHELRQMPRSQGREAYQGRDQRQ